MADNKVVSDFEPNKSNIDTFNICLSLSLSRAGSAMTREISTSR